MQPFNFSRAIGRGAIDAAGIVFSLTMTNTTTSHQEDQVGGTTSSFTNLDIGSPDPNRYVVVCLGTRETAMVTPPTQVTINGTVANRVTGADATINSPNGAASWIYVSASPVTTGTTCTVAVTWGTTSARDAVAVYRLVTSNPTPTSSNGVGTTTTISASLTIPAGGAGIAFYFEQGAASAPTWSNATQNYAAAIGSSSEASGATVSATSAAISPGLNTAAVMSLAAWGP